ncbi:MAG: extracellular solute-binding protein [Proteobacteria bacterium]|nr:extracellular solute-binding protein [Pseudomonadota bacterium]
MIRILTLCCLVSLSSASYANEKDSEPDERHWQHGLSFYGGFKYPPGFAHFDYVNPNAPKGGRLVRAIGYSFNSFTPYINKGLTAPGLDAIIEPTLYDSLLRPSGDEIGVYYGSLAGEIAVSDDFTTVWMRMRPEARWHDGVPVSARDVQFTFEHIRDHGIAFNAAYASLKQVEAISEREVRFTYHYPVNLNGIMALGKVNILPEHYWRERDITETTTEPPLTSGPYRIGKFELGKFIEFERVDDYWGKDIGLHKGSFNIDVLRYEVYRDATVQREAFRKGLLDTFNEPSAALWVTGYDTNSGLLVQVQHTYQHYIGILSALAFNLTQDRFQDVRVREALYLAFDFDWMNDTFDYGVYEKPQSFFHGTFMAATGLPSEDELVLLEPFRDDLPPRVFDQAPFAGSAIARMSRREALVRAQGLLAEAGWEFRNGGLKNAAGEPLEIEFLVPASGQQRARLAYVEQLKRLGISAHVRLVESAQYVSLLRAKKADAVAGSLAISMPPNQEVPAYLSSQSRGPANFAHLSSPIVDALIVQLLTASTREELMTAGRALDRVLFWQFYFIPHRLVDGQRIVMWNKFAKPAIQSLDMGGFPATWWWDPAKAEQVNRNLKNR